MTGRAANAPLTVVQIIRDETYGQLRHAQNLAMVEGVRSVFVGPERAGAGLGAAAFIACNLNRRPSFHTLRAARRLAKALLPFRPDLVHSHSVATLPAAIIVGRTLGVPLVHSPHALPVRGLSGGTWEVAGAMGLVRLAAIVGTRFIAVSELEEQRLAALCGHHRVHLALNPVPPRYLEAGTVPREPSTILSLSRFWPQKAPLLTLDAFSTLARRDPSARLIWAGDGPLFDSTRARAAQLGLADRVSFLGPVQDPLPLLHHAGILLSSSEFEAMPYAVIEAMASGCAVAATDIPAHRELDHGSGALSLGSPSRLGETLAELALDHERRARMAKTAREVVETRHTVEAFAVSIRASYQAVLSAAAEKRGRAPSVRGEDAYEPAGD